MSVELPEAHILAGQMDMKLRGKRVKSCQIHDCEKLQKLGFLNKDVKVFDGLINGKIESVTSRGNVIRVKLDNGMNLILAPEYGGRIAYHQCEAAFHDSFHLRLDFADDSVLAVRLTGMGVIQAFKDSDLEKSYVYRRDFSETPSPIEDERFTFKRFSESLASRKDVIKSLLVGKDAVVVGLGNSAYQDIIYRARIYPKRKASELSQEEKLRLYDAMKLVVNERIRLGGKTQFSDLYGNQGNYTTAIGSQVKTCPACGTPIEKLSIGGGQTYYCPKCQK